MASPLVNATKHLSKQDQFYTSSLGEENRRDPTYWRLTPTKRRGKSRTQCVLSSVFHTCPSSSAFLEGNTKW